MENEDLKVKMWIYDFIPLYWIKGHPCIDTGKDPELSKVIETLPLKQFYNKTKKVRISAYQICFPWPPKDLWEPEFYTETSHRTFKDTYPSINEALDKALEYYLKYEESLDL